MTNNILLWQNDIAFIQESWVNNRLFSPRWTAETMARTLDLYQINDYKIIITETPTNNLLDSISSFNEQCIVIVHVDHLHHNDLLRLINYTSDNDYTIPFLTSDTIKNLIIAANNNPTKTIVFYALVSNLYREIDSVTLPPNLKIGFSTTGVLGHKAQEYKDLIKLTEKATSNTKNFVCLNNANRPHRSALVAYLIGKQIHQHGHLTCRNFEKDVGCFLDWCFDSRLHEHIANTINIGKQLFYNTELLDIPLVGSNYRNFETQLHDIYQHSYVEIISDTTFFEPSVCHNDKYIDNLCGACFPIFISSAGTVADLRNLGFDMFDDVVDHGYDQLVDPALRLAQAIELNYQLLTDLTLAKELWYKHRQRFINNQIYFVTEFNNVVHNRLTTTINDAVIQLTKSK